MNYIKLTKVFEKECGIHIMVNSSTSSRINDSEYYLFNDSTIRKEVSNQADPEFIVLITKDLVFIGLFKRSHLAEEEKKNPVCWNKVY